MQTILKLIVILTFKPRNLHVMYLIKKNIYKICSYFTCLQIFIVYINGMDMLQKYYSFVFVEFPFSWFSMVLSNHERYGVRKIYVTKEAMHASIIIMNSNVNKHLTFNQFMKIDTNK